MRVLGVDLGAKRIGLALSDRTGTIATPLSVLARSGSVQRDHTAIKALAIENEVTTIVVGLPLNMNGTMGPAAQAAMREAEALGTVVGMPVVTFDERRTSVTANQALIEGGLDGRSRRKVVDKVAAAVMLQHWLDSRATGTS